MASPNPFTTPAAPAPPGQESNLVNPVNEYQNTIYAICILLIVLPTVPLALRFWVKLTVLKDLGISDACALISWAFLIVLCIMPFALVQNGMGLHIWDVPIARISRFAELINIHILMYVCAVLFGKIAILRQFADIFVGTSGRNTRWWIIHALIIFNILFLTPVFFILIFQCNPREKIWNPMVPGSCIDEHRIFITTSSINILDDLLILMLPILWISKLHAARRHKIGVGAVFGIGVFAVITSIVRLVESIYSFDSEDVTIVFIPVALWSLAEVASPLIVFALPVLPRLFRRSNRSQAGSQYPTNGYSMNHMSRHSAFHSMRKGDEEDGSDEWDGMRTNVRGHPQHPPLAARAGFNQTERGYVNHSYPEIYRTVKINQTSHVNH